MLETTRNMCFKFYPDFIPIYGFRFQVSEFNTGCRRPDACYETDRLGCQFIKGKIEILFRKRSTIHHTLRCNHRSAAIHPTARGGFFSFDPCLDNVGGTAHARGNPDGVGRSILGACPALHASVEIFDCRLFPFHLKHSVGSVGADTFTHAASHTSFSVKLPRRYAG